MQKHLTFQDEKSSKFWKIETCGKSFTVTFGKIGTNGQTQTKEFESEEKCAKEAEKLIAEKLKKGYLEEENNNMKKYLKKSPIKVLNSRTKLGQSKLGGWPHVPKDFKWPQDRDDDLIPCRRETESKIKNLPFLCQINLKEFPGLFAESGMLYFFCTMEPDEIYDWAVVYLPSPETLSPLEVPIDTSCMDCEFPLPEFTLVTAKSGDSFLMGTGDYIQTNLEEETPLYYEDVTDEDAKGPYSLLLQLDANDFNKGKPFYYICGDGGRIYFLTPTSSFKTKDFWAAYAEMQID